MEINVIVAIQDKDWGIGIGGDQPYSFKTDFANFKEKTKEGYGSVTMGRKTWEALPKKFRPLEGRLNIVVTRNKNYPLPEGVLRAESYEHAKKLAVDHNPTGQVWNIGGGQLYQEALQDDSTKEIYLTRVYDGKKACDVFFPNLEKKFKKEEVGDLQYHQNRFDKKYYYFRFEKWVRI